MTKRVALLPNFDDNDLKLSRFVAEFVGANAQPTASEFSLDFSNLRWIDGAAITVLSNTIEWLTKRGCKVRFDGLNLQMAGVKYLDDSKFFEMYLGKRISPISELRATTVPLQRLEHSTTLAWLNTKLVPWLSARLNMSEASFGEIVMCIYEIFNNIEDHSEERIGCVFVQLFPQISRVVISISDFGIGIPGSMRVAFPGVSDSGAIVQAFEEGVTSKKHGKNLGAGLWLLRQNVVTRNKGQLRVFSNFGRLTCSIDGESVQNRSLQTRYFYPGTLFQIHLRTDTIEAVMSEAEELEW